MRREVSLRTRLIAMGALITALLVAATLLTISTAAGSLQDNADVALAEYANAVIADDQVQDALDGREPTDAWAPSPAFPPGRPGTAFRLTDRNGIVLARGGEGLGEVAERAGVEGYDDVDGWRTLARTLPNDAVLVVAARQSLTDDIVTSVRQSLVVLLGLTMLALAVAMYWLLRSVVEPLQVLATDAERAAGGDTEVCVDTAALLPEAAVVGDALNHLLDAQRSALAAERASAERMRAFVADASHELRTPLTAISGWSDLLGGDRLDEQRRRRGLERIRSEASRLSRLVEDLLALARADAAGPEAARSGTCDATATLAPLVEDHRMLDPTRPVTLDVAEDLGVALSADHLTQIAQNLLANLRAHTPSGTSAALSLSRLDAARVVLEYCDDGPGIEDPARAFARFWRADPSRAGNGTGLGLSLVESLATSSGGSALAENLEPAGLRIAVTLPLAESGDPQASSSEV